MTFASRVVPLLLAALSLTPSLAAAQEGFFAIDQLPKDTLGISPTVIAAAARSTGVLLFTRKMVLSRENALQMKSWFCDTPEARAIEEPYCGRLASAECASGCTLQVRRAKCSGVRLGSYFVVSKHCLSEASPPTDPKALFFGATGKHELAELETTSETLAKNPYDLAIYRIRGSSGSSAQATALPLASAREGEVVFGVGMPFLGFRKDLASKGYSKTTGIRVTFGKVIDLNANHKSFCAFTNEDAPDAESWKLETGCKAAPLPGRHEERDPLLTDTDMTYGMSGSPLFNAQGALLGIGSNVLSRSPENYSAEKHAVYVKAIHAEEAIKRLSR